jgi:hypothetical protein
MKIIHSFFEFGNTFQSNVSCVCLIFNHLLLCLKMFARSTVVQSFFVYAISNEKQLIEIKGDLLELVLSKLYHFPFFTNMPIMKTSFLDNKKIQSAFFL